MRRSGVDGRALIPTCFPRCNRARLSACALAVVAGALIAGCAQQPTQFASAKGIPLPEKALLEPQPEPDCRFTSADAKTDDRQKLDYQQQCYRQAEMIVHERLRRLQKSVGKTIEAVNRSDNQ
jgi:hypothetical protein